MTVGSIFLDFNLPNATTWLYFSAFLAVALFFKFGRLFSVRNLDVITLFLLMPGLILLRERAGNWFGYLWLMVGSFYFLVRCVWDLALLRRPLLSPNLSLGGLAWMAVALYGCLAVVAFRLPLDHSERLVKGSPVLDQAQQQTESLLHQQMALTPAHGLDVAFVAGCSLALLCHLAVLVGLVVVGWRHFQDVHAGMACAAFYLLLPCTGLYVGEWHHVWPMALVVWAVVCYRAPLAAGLLLGLATGTMYFPGLIFPVWLSFYWGRGMGRFSAAFVLAAGVCLAVVGTLLHINGELPASLRAILSLSDWQPWIEPRPGSEGFWTGVRWAWAYRIPVFVAYLAFLITTALWPYPKDLAHLLSLSAAALIGVQFWYADKGGVYVLWYLPLLLLVVFRPNLADRRPPPIHPETDWLYRLGRALRRFAGRWTRHPEQPARVR